QQKVAVIDAGVTSNIRHHLVSFELPLGIRQFAGGNAAVVHDVVVGTGLLDDLARKSERSRRGKNHAAAFELQSSGGSDVVKASCLGGHVVISMACFDVVIVRAAINPEVSRGRYLAGV